MATKGKNGNGFKAHEETYTGFLNFLVYGTVGTAVVVAIVLALIS